jgi:hypothetical protein
VLGYYIPHIVFDKIVMPTGASGINQPISTKFRLTHDWPSCTSTAMSQSKYYVENMIAIENLNICAVKHLFSIRVFAQNHSILIHRGGTVSNQRQSSSIITVL